MAIKIISTKGFGAGHGSKVMVYSEAGVGKTVLCSTAPTPFIISAESGLLSLQDFDIPATEINNVDDLNDVYEWVTGSKEAEQFETICLDSITEIAEVLLTAYKAEFTDARQAYGKLADDMNKSIRAFRDIKGKNVYFSAKQARVTDDIGVTSYVASMPGKQLLNGLPFFFDEVFPMKIGKLEDGTTYRYLQTHGDLQYAGKDRSGRLDPIEEPNLTKIFNKIISKEND